MDTVEWLENRPDSYQAAIGGRLVFASLAEANGAWQILIFPGDSAFVEPLAKIRLAGTATRSWKRIAEDMVRALGEAQ